MFSNFKFGKSDTVKTFTRRKVRAPKELVDVKKDWAQKREIQKKKASVNESLFE